jgi:glycosyltransferase involved in cell wall biosynthesis
MTKVCWISSETPDRFGQGGQRRQFHLITAVARAGHDVVVAHLNSDQDPSTVRAVAPTDGFDTFGRSVTGRVRNRTSTRFDHWVRAQDPDVVVLGHAVSSRLVPATLRDRHRPVIVDFHNVDSRWLRSIGDQREAERARSVETRLLRRAASIVSSVPERNALLEGFDDPLPVCLIVPQGADPAEWPTPPSIPEGRPVVAGFGSLWYPPHRESVTWFVREVWPLVRRRVPTAEYHLIGPGTPDDDIASAEGVVVRGRVPDLASEIAGATVVVVPTRGGPGSRVKFPESLMSGRPVVATSIAAEGFETDGTCRIADDPNRFADAVAEFLTDRDRAEQFGASGRDHALRSMTWDAAAAALNRYLDGVGAAEFR